LTAPAFLSTLRSSLAVPAMTLRIADFRALREQVMEYVDKTHLVREVLDKVGTQVLLLPRPRRFGKTLNLSMMRYFFEKRPADLSPLFEGLAIFQAGDAYRAHFQLHGYASEVDGKQVVVRAARPEAPLAAG
jgi:hypothetical protein